MRIKEIMTKEVITVAPDMDVRKLAELFITKDISGAPVVDEAGKLIGVVVEESLIFQDKKVHLPTFISLAMGYISFGAHQFQEEIKRIAANKVGDIMNEHPEVISPESSVEEVATKIVEKRIYYFPVIENGLLAGVVTRKDIVRAIAQRKL